jgi:polyhydroxyalkanoate synthesis regulator phasin
MAGADDDADAFGSEREPLDRMLSAIGLRVEDARSLVEGAAARWRGDALRLNEGTRHRLKGFFHDLGLVTREEWDELELRIAQLEHRLRLVEDRED